MLLIESCDYEIINFSQMYCMYVGETINPNTGEKDWTLRVRGYTINFNVAHGTRDEMKQLLSWLVPVLKLHQPFFLTQAMIQHHLANLKKAEAPNGEVYERIR